MTIYEIRTDDTSWQEVDCATLDAACICAADAAAEGWPEDRASTIWIGWRARPADDPAEERNGTVAVDPPEPPCRDDDNHDWQAPHELVGGLADNPGVHGHGGGLIFSYACVRCGCGRQRDTWATNPNTGEQGLDSVSYEPCRYDVEEVDDE